MCLIEMLIFNLEFRINNSRISEQGDFRTSRVKLKGRNALWKGFSTKVFSSSGSERTRWSHVVKLSAVYVVNSFEMEQSGTSLKWNSQMQEQFFKKSFNFHVGHNAGPHSTSFLMRCCADSQKRSESKWPRCRSAKRQLLCFFTIAIATHVPHVTARTAREVVHEDSMNF